MRFFGIPKADVATCSVCGKSSRLISGSLGVCRECILEGSSDAKDRVASARRRLRLRFPLPEEIPRRHGSEMVRKCTGCVNRCEIAEGGLGFCGLRAVRDGRLEVLAGTHRGALVDWYYDGLPTNCVGSFVCPGGTGCGYPQFSHAKNEPEYGYKNLAVFYRACTFDCAFCQNWHFRKADAQSDKTYDAKALAMAADEKTSCICYFGGDPTPQLTHSLKAGRLAREIRGEDEILRICWESNGSMPRALARPVAELALTSGGCVKFDLKVMNSELHQALTGTSNKNTFENFKYIHDTFSHERKVPPLQLASTLMVPGYVGAEEVREIAGFIAELDPNIPYSLLAFHPDFNMMDMGTTTRAQARECENAARDAGLKRIHIGNLHLLL